MLLFVVSPVLWYVLWPHPEVFSACFVALALLFVWEGRGVMAVLCAALASTQNPPLVLLVGLLWLRAGSGGPQARWHASASGPGLGEPGGAAGSSVPGLLPASLRGSESLGGGGCGELRRNRCRQAHKAFELFFDLNLGLLPFVPVALLGAIGFGSIAMRRGPALRLGLPFVATVFLVALACTTTGNWNHGMSGPSRYAVWLLPFALVAFVAAQPTSLRGRRCHATVAILAIASQAAVLLSRLPRPGPRGWRRALFCGPLRDGPADPPGPAPLRGLRRPHPAPVGLEARGRHLPRPAGDAGRRSPKDLDIATHCSRPAAGCRRGTKVVHPRARQ